MYTSKTYDISPLSAGEAVTPSDTVDFGNRSRAIWVGTGGDLVVVLDGQGEGVDDYPITLTNVQDGSLLPITCKRINSTNTTAGSITALY